MRTRTWSTVLLVVLLLAVSVTVVQAQAAVKGAIRGTIFQDTNADGVCGGGDPTMAGLPIDFVPDGGQLISLLSGSDGSYGLASIGLGTWRVTARPPAGWVTTSQPTLTVVLTSEQNTAENVNFCLAQSSDGSSTLPESGAPVPPTLLITAVLGTLLLIAGMVLKVWVRQASD